MSFAKWLLALLFRLEAFIAIAAYCLIAGLLLGDVLLRETVSSSIWGAQRLSVYAMILTGFLGLGLAAARGEHLRPRFADGLIPKALSRFADRVGSFLMAAVFLLFAYVGIEFVMEAFQYQDRARIIDFPLWILQLIVPYAFASTAIRYLSFALYPALKPEEKMET